MSNQVSVEKRYKYGFVLNEQELRRINDIIIQQMTELIPKDALKIEFELNFKNGIKEVKTNVDHIFAETNGGPWEILTLNIRSFSSGPLAPANGSEISIEFDKKDSKGIDCNIEGNDRNWVYLTISKIEERLRAIKRFMPNDTITFLLLFLIPPFYIVSILLLLTIIFFPSHTSLTMPLGDALLSVFTLILLAIGLFAFIYCFPSHNFYWGDYAKKFDRRQSVGKWILAGIILAIILGVIGGIIANYLTIRIGISH